MARIKLGPVITNISGSIGGLTIQRNRFGLTLREKPLPRDPFTSSQYSIRSKISYIQSAWQNLTDAQRLQWDRFLDFSGQTIKHDKNVKLSGHSLYLKYQLFRLLTGQNLLSTIVYSPMPSTPSFSYIDWDSPNLRIRFDNNVVHTSYFFIFSLTSPRLANKAFSKMGLRFMLTTFNTDYQYSIQTPYVAAFGALPLVAVTLHYSLRWFSVVSPVYSGVYHGTCIVQ